MRDRTDQRPDRPSGEDGSVTAIDAEEPVAAGDAVDAEERIPLARERVRVEKREVERLAARIQLRTHEEDVRINETLHREQIDIERVPVDRVVDDVPVTRTEDGATVIPIVEEVFVKRFRVIEEIHLRPRFEAHAVDETVRLRRQVATVDEMGDGAASGSEHPASAKAGARDADD